jgi:hypothetical protein
VNQAILAALRGALARLLPSWRHWPPLTRQTLRADLLAALSAAWCWCRKA